MTYKPRVKPEAEFTPLEKELFTLATQIGVGLHSQFLVAIDQFFNPLIRREGGLSQVHVWSFIGKVYNVFCSKVLLTTRDIADTNGDNECTLKQFFEEFNYGTKLYLKIPDEPKLPGGIMPMPRSNSND